MIWLEMYCYMGAAIWGATMATYHPLDAVLDKEDEGLSAPVVFILWVITFIAMTLFWPFLMALEIINRRK